MARRVISATLSPQLTAGAYLRAAALATSGLLLDGLGRPRSRAAAGPAPAD